ncbi:MAG: tRNA (guanosine(37)-N1)-methyltransferase TrmD [Thermodesulfovibrionales bacterium]
MNCSVVTIFPDVINAYLGASIMKRAIAKGLLNVQVHDLRAYTFDKHHTVDDYPYGGGAGMVMKPEPFFRIAEELWPDRAARKIILLSPMGRKFDQNCAEELLREKRELVFFCGRYEAIDERVHQYLADEEISVGDYVLTGGELPSLVIIDAVTRLIPGALGDCRSAEADSFSSGLLDYPHYTRPENFSGKEVPPVLLSGNHSEVSRWRKKQALKATMMKRPDLFDTYKLSEDDMKLLDEIKEEN